ncbi:MAG TPA: S8/S53 family peptidase [Candidatus Thermoplasmatota archaeon]|nr:S8/S53 family peptidase [Candidatus Thermoplasmatota archaeon]
MRTVPLVLVALCVASFPAAPAASPFPQDDAGSGRDAPDALADDVVLSPDVRYEAIAAPDDLHDWYALDAAGPGPLSFSYAPTTYGCLEVTDAAGARIGYRACRGGVAPGGGTVTLPAAGRYYLHHRLLLSQGGVDVEDGVARYVFGFAFAGTPPPPDPVAVPDASLREQDDAGSGRDAGANASSAVAILPNAAYSGWTDGHAFPDHEDWYRIEGAVFGDEVGATLSAPGEACISIVDAGGRSLAPSACSPTQSATGPVRLPGDGPWFVAVNTLAPSGYGFSSSRVPWDGVTPIPSGGGPTLPPPTPASQAGAHAVVAVIDTGINPYHEFFRAPALADHPSTWLPGFPASAQTVALSLDEPGFDEAFDADEATWRGLARSRYDAPNDTFEASLYTFPGTRVIGAVSFGEPGSVLDTPTTIPILDERGHGTHSAGLALGANLARAEGDVLLVAVETGGATLAEGIRWAARQPYIDAISISWGKATAEVWAPEGVLLDGGLPSAVREALDNGKAVLYASGNGFSGTADPPDHCVNMLNAEKAQPGVVRIGAATPDGQPTWWHCVPVEAIARTDVPSPDGKSMKAATLATGTSASAPNAAGHLADLLLRARRAGADPAPRDALEHLLHASERRAWTPGAGADPSLGPTASVVQGYGLVDQAARDRALAAILAGAPPAARPDVEGWRAIDDAFRETVHPRGGLVGQAHAALVDDAGSGRDAPDAPRPEVFIVPGVAYVGAIMPLGGERDALFDNEDYYAFHARAGDQVRVWSTACLQAEGFPDVGWCAFGIPLEWSTATIPADGVYYLRTDFWLAGHYRFAFTLDGRDPRLVV